MKDTLWQKTDTKMNPRIERYAVGDDYLYDAALMPYDIRATSAHVKGLARIGVLTEAEKAILLSGLDSLHKEWARGAMVISAQDEDCHTVIERYLVDALGDVGKKVHTGRSRNDQVLVALRLYMKDALKEVCAKGETLAREFFSFAKKNQDVPLPGYSHTQQAMLSSVGHYFCSYLESLLDDLEFLDDVFAHIDKNPLGSAAGFGSSLALDREFITRELGFATTQINSLYCQTGRGKFECMFLFGLVQIMQTLNSIASDLILFTSREFDFFSVHETCVTGSSIMPQKKNMDGLEIIRAQCSVVRGYHTLVSDISHNLISGYHRDFQITKKYLMESVKIVTQSIDVMREYGVNLLPQEEIIRKKISKGIFSADVATAMAAQEGIPFREAYLKAYEKLNDIALDPKENIRSRVSIGAPGNLMLAHYEERLRRRTSG